MAYHAHCVTAQSCERPQRGDLWEGQLLVAEKDERKIAVAVNSFVGRSNLADVTQTFGQLALSRCGSRHGP